MKIYYDTRTGIAVGISDNKTSSIYGDGTNQASITVDDDAEEVTKYKQGYQISVTGGEASIGEIPQHITDITTKSDKIAAQKVILAEASTLADQRNAMIDLLMLERDLTPIE